jgi:hypothetical protein
VTEFQRLFLVQARTDFAVFELLQGQPELPACHSLHYLQMATELLGKAYALKDGPPTKTNHRALVAFLRNLSIDRSAQRQLGFDQQRENWRHRIRKTLPLASKIEDLAPQLAKDGPNPEYPWPPHAPRITPAEYSFAIWQDLQQTPAGRFFIDVIRRLFHSADVFL